MTLNPDPKPYARWNKMDTDRGAIENKGATRERARGIPLVCIALPSPSLCLVYVNVRACACECTCIFM